MTSTYVAYRLYTQDLNVSMARIEARTDVAREEQYYRDNIGKVTSVDDFLKDRRLFAFAMKAAGLEDMTNAPAFMRKVLESDLTDADSFTRRLVDPRYLAFARSFNFEAGGAAKKTLSYIQSDYQEDETIELYSEHRLRQGIAAAKEADYYQAKIPTLTSADQLISDKRLLTYALNAFGLNPNTASDSYVRSVLTSDLSDPSSVANQAANARYLTLASAFSFETNGTVALGLSAQTDAQLDDTVYLNFQNSGLGTSPAAAASETKYFTEQMAAVTSVDDVINNPRLFDYALSAFGIDASIASASAIRQVLTSDLSDPGSYVNVTFTNPSYRKLAEAFSFAADGSVSGTNGAQTSAQLKTVTAGYLTTYDDAVEASETSSIAYYRGRIDLLSNVDDLFRDVKLYKIVREAFGLDTSVDSKNKIKRVLTSDLTDPTSFANRQPDKRYRELAAHFNFAPDGSSRQPLKAQVDLEELATIRRYNATTSASTDDDAQTASENAYYHNTITRVPTVDAMLSDKRLMAYVLKAYGLEDDKLPIETLRKVLTSDAMDKSSYVNTQSDDTRLRDLAAAFNFTADGHISREQAMTAQSRSSIVTMSDAFVRQTMENDAGDQNAGVRLALYFKRKAASITTPLGILADKAIFEVVRTALGLPSSMSTATIELQTAMIEKRLDVKDFQDPEKVEKFLARFSGLYDLENGIGSTASAASIILGGSGSDLGTNTDLMLRLQQVTLSRFL